MHIALLGPDLFPAFHDFARGLKLAGARVTGVGSTPPARLRAGLKRHLDSWEQVRSPFDGAEVARVLARATARRQLDRLETVEERLIESAAEARRQLGLQGLSVEAARLCRDKPAMKDALRRAGIACAESAGVESLAELRLFAEQHGYPLVLKPRAGLGSLETFRVDDSRELERAAIRLGVTKGQAAAVEEFVEGHEGFYDTISIAGEPAVEFVSHYFPSVLEALSDRRIAPQIAATNRIDLPSYDEIREVGRKVIRALDIGTSATHMEWFFGPKGLKVSEIGARPPGERIWDLYCVGNDIDLYRFWAEAMAAGRLTGKPSRRLATGSVQVRPDREGRIVRYQGIEEVLQRCGEAIFAHELPPIGRKSVPISKGYLANSWFRLQHPDYDTLREMMSWIGRTLRVHAA